ncbi:hypothetical protein THAOC_35912 [Thalassiosira oceanica]|uniref:Uncharacterized protein n=1 Tax=Thalassiosira oceanica TaxID=159749 RepID=K0R072_THAOC|nr:hypothetical protein THAOC_35912 [Thalassiosira oceanica]|eukprot:EJK45468.1 hypothetical protein THAOC_35912 [Thalassiosira oceanica]
MCKADLESLLMALPCDDTLGSSWADGRLLGLLMPTVEADSQKLWPHDSWTGLSYTSKQMPQISSLSASPSAASHPSSSSSTYTSGWGSLPSSAAPAPPSPATPSVQGRVHRAKAM